MPDQYVVKWQGQEYVIRNIFMGRSHALNMAREFAEAKRKDLDPVLPITIEYQDDSSGAMKTWLTATHVEGKWSDWRGPK